MQKPLWTCPACGERFVSPGLWHSCGRHSYDALFARSEPHVRRIVDKLATLARDDCRLPDVRLPIADWRLPIADADRL